MVHVNLMARVVDQIRTLGVLLAGGASRRFGADKRRALLAGQPLLEWVVERARPQVEMLLLNSNECEWWEGVASLERVADDLPGEGPLSGILAGLAAAQDRGFTHLASFACDTPFFPRNTVACLASALQSSTADYAVASCGATAHRVFALWPAACRIQLEHAFLQGTRSLRDIEHWLEPTWADFRNNGGPGADPFFNINTVDDLHSAQRWLVAQSSAGKY